MTTWYRRTPESETLFAEERLLLSATEMVHAALDVRGVTKKKLAEMLDVTPTEVSQRLSGRRNLTLRSLARMMHVLGYRVGLDSETLSEELGPHAPGTRITRHLMDRGDAPERAWSLCFRAAIGAEGIKDPTDFADHISALWSNLQTLDHISSARLDHREDQIMVELQVRADDLLQACTRGTAAVRTAIHSAGGGTPGWEKEMERLVRQLRLDVSSEPECIDEKYGQS
ncbi:helix-turn-helix domain-containing protein [Nocardia sp. JW2]|uniref:helix-turn-helix domain-containing protein n=1 Tax=Nocardia sp. JW2 TaxID=3450738 RepID=UPI003F422A37